MLAGLWRWLRVTFMAFLVAAVLLICVALLAGRLYLNLSHSGDFTLSPLIQGLWTAQSVLGYLTQVILLTANVLFARYLYRAMKNARQIRADVAIMSPAWAVISNFIPAANLWSPFEALRQILRASPPKEAARALAWLAAWQGLWVLYWLFVIASAALPLLRRLESGSPTETFLGTYATELSLALAGDGFLALAVLCALGVLSKMTHAQDLQAYRQIFE